MENESTYWLYFLECDNDKIYTGSTDNVVSRFKKHKAGQGSTWTGNNVPINIIAVKFYQSRSDAYSQERKLKKYSRIKKLNWVQANCIYDHFLVNKLIKK